MSGRAAKAKRIGMNPPPLFTFAELLAVSRVVRSAAKACQRVVRFSYGSHGVIRSIFPTGLDFQYAVIIADIAGFFLGWPGVRIFRVETVIQHVSIEGQLIKTTTRGLGFGPCQS